MKANRYIVNLKYPGAGTLPFGNIPFQYSKTPVTLRPGPWPGQDTERVLREGWGTDDRVPAKGYFGPTGPVDKGPLEGVTVVDMTQGICGPYASLLLADAGARVVKVEPPEGDYARHFSPALNGVSSAFFHLNRNKEGVRLDIGKEQERLRLLELLKSADVLIEETGQRADEAAGAGLPGPGEGEPRPHLLQHLAPRDQGAAARPARLRAHPPGHVRFPEYAGSRWGGAGPGWARTWPALGRRCLRCTGSWVRCTTSGGRGRVSV